MIKVLLVVTPAGDTGKCRTVVGVPCRAAGGPVRPRTDEGARVPADESVRQRSGQQPNRDRAHRWVAQNLHGNRPATARVAGGGEGVHLRPV